MLTGMRTILATLHSKYIHASLALPCLAAYCGNSCGDILIEEFTVHEPREQVLAALLAAEPDVVAFSVYLWNRRETLDLIDALRAAAPHIRTVIGGPEVSFDGPQLFARHPGLSALVRGEGEIPLRGLLEAWRDGKPPGEVPRLSWRSAAGVEEGPHAPPLADLDVIPSPFAAGQVDLSRGLVYYETSRGCPYTCAFCMSSLDSNVRSFSLERIRADLGLLMARGVPQIKLVDRTFNYDAARAREIFRFILAHNRASRFHFEIGAHLLDGETLALLRRVPPNLFQFEIGVQSTLPATLSAIGRSVSLKKLEENVRALRETDNIHLHLDLIAGLPGENYRAFLSSLDRVAALRPHHLQVEAVKLLPGSPLREQAQALGIRHDPNPPYRVLATAELSFAELEKLRGISRLLDLTYNADRLAGFLHGLSEICGSLGAGLERLERFWRSQDLHRLPVAQRSLFEHLGHFIANEFAPSPPRRLTDLLARDYARCERVTTAGAPAFFDQNLSCAEQQQVRRLVRAAHESLRGQGVKLQFFAAVFHALPEFPQRTPMLFLYHTRSGAGLKIEEIPL
ncbi:anaerobic magnesium-protoporphyrin IX monomethyl ester cyclase [Geoalkalibacter ferrihydriticus]|nr:anaerobic magnesium-protoporphyrin IX monomethyl ester cyclase [Geoalkalibacter ferrihydriticus]